MEKTEKLAISIREFATKMGISQAHAWRLVDSGEVQSIKLGKRHCIPIKVIDKMLGDTPNEDEVQLSA